MKKYAIGTDIGGSHISCAVIDLVQEKILKETFNSEKVDNKASSDDILTHWSNALKKTLSGIDKKDLEGIGFAMPGPFEYDKGIARFTHEVAKYENLNGVNVGQKIKDLLQLDRESDVRFMNDASAFAVGESWLGRAAGYSRSVSITLGTGFGSAFIKDGIPVVGGNEVPMLGCVWHLSYKDGIADGYFSTRWFISEYQKKSGILTSGAKDIADQATSNIYAMDTFVKFGENLGHFLAPWLKTFHADVLVIGGNVSGAYSLFGSRLENTLKEHNVSIPIKISDLMEDAAIIGSARMFNPDIWKNIKPILSKM